MWVGWQISVSQDHKVAPVFRGEDRLFFEGGPLQKGSNEGSPMQRCFRFGSKALLLSIAYDID